MRQRRGAAPENRTQNTITTTKVHFNNADKPEYQDFENQNQFKDNTYPANNHTAPDYLFGAPYEAGPSDAVLGSEIALVTSVASPVNPPPMPVWNCSARQTVFSQSEQVVSGELVNDMSEYCRSRSSSCDLTTESGPYIDTLQTEKEMIHYCEPPPFATLAPNSFARVV